MNHILPKLSGNGKRGNFQKVSLWKCALDFLNTQLVRGGWCKFKGWVTILPSASVSLVTGDSMGRFVPPIYIRRFFPSKTHRHCSFPWTKWRRNLGWVYLIGLLLVKFCANSQKFAALRKRERESKCTLPLVATVQLLEQSGTQVCTSWTESLQFKLCFQLQSASKQERLKSKTDETENDKMVDKQKVENRQMTTFSGFWVL